MTVPSLEVILGKYKIEDREEERSVKCLVRDSFRRTG